jgi:formylglycine-generating enzyme required for sulfatase activity
MKAKFIKPKMIRILNSLSIDMVLIKKGSFLMDEGKEQKKVTIEKDFYMGKYPVTIAEYMHFVRDTKSNYPEWLEEGNEYNIKTGTNDHYKKMNLTDNAPIIGISWYDAKEYCKWLSKKTGKNYRLPTQKEWEYSCRAGTTTKWSFGDDEKELKKYAWYGKNSDGTTHEVGEKLPNPWGLYDMHGNVWEWCEDWYDEEKKEKVLRGGSWGNSAVSTRSSGRLSGNPTNRDDYWGFRVLRTLPSDLGDYKIIDSKEATSFDIKKIKFNNFARYKGLR